MNGFNLDNKKAADKRMAKMRKESMKKTEKRDAITRSVDEKNRLSKKRTLEEDIYELTLNDELCEEKRPIDPISELKDNKKPYSSRPMPIVFYSLKATKDPALLYSDIISNGRFHFENKHLYTLDEEYLRKKSLFLLWSWQEDAICFINERETDRAGIGCRGLMLCLDMGLGKTIISLEHILRDNQRCYRQTGNRFNGCTLIVCQNVLLVENWLYEVRKMWPPGTFQYYHLQSSKNRRISRLYIENCCDFVIVTYSTVKSVYSYNLKEDDTKLYEDDKFCVKEEEEEEEEEQTDTMEEESELSVRKEKQRTESERERQYKYDLLFKTKWKRIISDESHLFVNPRTILYKAMIALHSEIKWGVTGTPIQNSILDLRSELNFIDLQSSPFPHQNNKDLSLSESDKQRIKQTLEVVMICMLKKDIATSRLDSGLPVFTPVKITVKLIEFETVQEKAIYYLYATYASRNWETIYKKQLEDINEKRSHKAATSIFSTLLLMMQLCIGLTIVNKLILPRGMLTLGNCEKRLRLSKTSFSDELYPNEKSRPVSPSKKTDTTLEYCASLLDKRTDFSYSSDSIVLNLPPGYELEYSKTLSSEPITDISALAEKKNTEKIHWDPYSTKEPGLFDLENDEADRTQYKTLYETLKKKDECIDKATLTHKMKAMIRHLKKRSLPRDFCTTKNCHVIQYIQNTPENDKIVVFSNSILALEDLSYELGRRDIKSTLVSGDTHAYNSERMNRFRDDPEIKVLLLSLKLGSFGLNLICANHILFLHPWWNPNLIEQAQNRCTRLGQMKAIFIVHFIMNKTIELYMANLSYNKKDMTSTMIGNKTQTNELAIEIEDKELENQLMDTDVLAIVNNNKLMKEYAYNLYEYKVTQDFTKTKKKQHLLTV